MDLQAYLQFLADHPFAIVFCAFFIEAIGVPFPSRMILILTPAFLAPGDLGWLVAAASLGAVLGDHVPYLAARRAGIRILGLYCRVTLASTRCVETALRHFTRFGSAALLLARFSTSVRLFAAACAGCTQITYSRYLTFDTIGTVVYASLWVLVGYFIGERAVVFFTTDRRRWLFVGLVAVAALTLLGYRLWRRTRYGGARVSSLDDARRMP